MNAPSAARCTAEGEVAILMTDAAPTAAESRRADAEVRADAGSADAAAPESPEVDVKSLQFGDGVPEPSAPRGAHLFMLSRAAIATESSGGRRRLHHFEAATDVHLEAEHKPLADLLLRLGSATRALPPPGPRDTLVQLDEPTEVAGLRLAAGAVAALDFDPMAVLPQLRGLNLYPWRVLPIDKLDAGGCHGEALEAIRLVFKLDRPWQPLRSPGFLAGVTVDATYRDYRRQPPAGQVVRAYFTHGDRRPPRAVLAD
ncbi:MAG: hypothetical protein AAGM22_12830 [Acidobacteriota bacterium]